MYGESTKHEEDWKNQKFELVQSLLRKGICCLFPFSIDIIQWAVFKKIHPMSYITKFLVCVQPIFLYLTNQTLNLGIHRERRGEYKGGSWMESGRVIQEVKLPQIECWDKSRKQGIVRDLICSPYSNSWVSTLIMDWSWQISLFLFPYWYGLVKKTKFEEDGDRVRLWKTRLIMVW